MLATAAVGALIIGVLVLATAGLANRQRQFLEVEESVVEAGPVPGTELDTYIEQQEAAMAEAPAGRTRAAIVSLVHYDDADAIDRLLDEIEREAGVRPEPLALLAAVPGSPEAVVRGEFDEWVETQRQEVEAERAEIERLLPTVEPGTEFAAFYTEELARFDRILTLLDADGELVHGVVVEGAVGALRRLAEDGDVRLVDLVDGRVTDDTVARGLRPEETDVAGEPRLRPSPVV